MNIQTILKNVVMGMFNFIKKAVVNLLKPTKFSADIDLCYHTVKKNKKGESFSRKLQLKSN